MEAAAEAFDVYLVEFALAAENFGDNARATEDIGEIFLQETVLVDEELDHFERLGTGKLVVAVLEILDQEGQEFGEFLFGGGQFLAAAVQFVEKRGAGFIFPMIAQCGYAAPTALTIRLDSLPSPAGLG